MTPDPVTTVLSALREKAEKATPELGQTESIILSSPLLWRRRQQFRAACSPALIAALCDVALATHAWGDTKFFNESAAASSLLDALRRLAAVIKEAGNG